MTTVETARQPLLRHDERAQPYRFIQRALPYLEGAPEDDAVRLKAVAAYATLGLCGPAVALVQARPDMLSLRVELPAAVDALRKQPSGRVAWESLRSRFERNLAAAVERFETVREQATLTEPQINALQMIERDFLTQSDAINRQLADLQKKREIEDQQRIFDRMTMMARGGFERGQGRGPGGPGGFFGAEAQDDPRRTLMQQKTDLVENTLNSVVALLTPEQLAAAPKPERRQARGGDRGGREMTDEQRREMEQRFRERRERGFDRDDGGN